MTGDHHDSDALRQRLGAADPAAALPPAEPGRVDRLLEDVMTRTDETPAITAPARRARLVWVAAAAAVALVAALGVGALQLGRPASPGSSGQPVAAPEPTVTTLLAPAAVGSGRCQVPNAATLAGATLAIDGTVTALDGEQATLEVGRWYAGTATDQVVVTAPSEDLQALIQAVSLEQGGRYLLAAQGDTLMLCGYSAPYSPESAALYDEAFGS